MGRMARVPPRLGRGTYADGENCRASRTPPLRPSSAGAPLYVPPGMRQLLFATTLPSAVNVDEDGLLRPHELRSF